MIPAIDSWSSGPQSNTTSEKRAARSVSLGNLRPAPRSRGARLRRWAKVELPHRRARAARPPRDRELQSDAGRPHAPPGTHQAAAPKPQSSKMSAGATLAHRRTRAPRRQAAEGRSSARAQRRNGHPSHLEQPLFVAHSTRWSSVVTSLVADSDQLSRRDAHERRRRVRGRLLVQHDLQALVRRQTRTSRS